MTQALPRVAASAPSAGLLSLGLSDCNVLAGRSLRHLTRNPEQLFQAITLPVILVLLFRYLIGGAIRTGTLSYVDYMMAGLIVISLAFNSTATAVGVASDMGNGLVQRLRSMPVASPSVLVGHVVSALLRNAISAAVIIALGFAVGFRPHASALSWLGALGLLALFAIGLSWLAVLLGLTAQTAEGATGLVMILVFLPYASSALVPTQTMPSAIRGVIRDQPVTLVIDTVRALLTGQPASGSGWPALIWWLAIAIAAVPVSVRLFRRRCARA
jgi:ABC-2 type transport system permease protein